MFNRSHRLQIECRQLIIIVLVAAILFGEIPQQGRHIGCIDPVCDPGSVVMDAYENARYLCDQYYLASPELKLTQTNGVDANAPIRIVYVPSHLYHMLFELFKNSMYVSFSVCLGIRPPNLATTTTNRFVFLFLGEL